MEKIVDAMKKACEWCKEHWKLIATIVIVAVSIVVLWITGVGSIISGACWGAILGACIGGVSGGINSAVHGGSFLEGFENGAFNGAISDAIGGAIHHIANIHKYARPEDVPEHTMFVITTDGMENASHIYSSDKVKKMIEHEKEKYGWEFLFIGANIDAVETAKHFGIDADRAVDYHADRKGTAVLY